MESGVEKVDSGAGGSQHKGVGRPRQLRACVGLVLVAVLAAAPLPLATQQEQRVVRGLSFDGNKAIDDYTLSTAIATSNSSFFASVWWLRWIGFLGEKRYFNELEFRRDVVRLLLLYRQSGYMSAVIDTLVRREGNDVFIRFRIMEGDPVRLERLEITGLDDILSVAPLKKDLPLPLGKRGARRRGAPCRSGRLDRGRGGAAARRAPPSYPHGRGLRDGGLLPRPERVDLLQLSWRGPDARYHGAPLEARRGRAHRLEPARQCVPCAPGRPHVGHAQLRCRPDAAAAVLPFPAARRELRRVRRAALGVPGVHTPGGGRQPRRHPQCATQHPRDRGLRLLVRPHHGPTGGVLQRIPGVRRRGPGAARELAPLRRRDGFGSARSGEQRARPFGGEPRDGHRHARLPPGLLRHPVRVQSW